MSPRPAFSIAGSNIAPGQRQVVEVPCPGAYGRQDLTLQVAVHHGRRAGPTLLICSGIHGDEILGAEIIRRLNTHGRLRGMRGTLLTVPMVNLYGFAIQSRYLPDRRDLNRFFPGSESGSMAARLAHTFLSEVALGCDVVIDLHTAAINRTNLPQIRAFMEDKRVEELAKAFAAPVTMDAERRDGSLRAALYDAGVPNIVFEAGEALRYDESCIRTGLRGIFGVMQHLDMIKTRRRATAETVVAKRSYWLRAPMAGLLRQEVQLGTQVSKGQLLGQVSDPLGVENAGINARAGGIVIGCATNPVVNEGDGVFHIAVFARSEVDSLAETIDNLDETLQELEHLGPDIPEQLPPPASAT